MPRLFVLFNLKPGVDPAEYERWAEERDAATVRALPSIDAFTVHRVSGALTGEPPYRYVEVIDVNDMDQFGKDIATPEMQRVAGEFAERADNPAFLVSEQFV